MSCSKGAFNPQTSWTRRRTLKICRLLQKNKLLWNTQHSQYDNLRERERAMLGIKNELAEEMPGLELNDVRKKIHNLRSQYRKQLVADELRRRKGLTRASQSWVLKELAFLRSNYVHKPNISKSRINVHGDPHMYMQSSAEDSDEEPIGSTQTIEIAPVECYELPATKRDEEDNLEFDERFAWLGKDIDNTFKSLRSEKLKNAALIALQKVLKNARARDSGQPHLANDSWKDSLNKFKDTECGDQEDESTSTLFEEETARAKPRSCFEWNYDMSIYNPEEIEIKIHNDELFISACHMELEANGMGYVTRKFERSFELPNGYDDNIEATLSEDGMLTIKAVERQILDEFEERKVIIQHI